MIVSIHSFRRGVGKSSLTANLAVALAQRGQRIALIDTDLQFPSLHLLFGLDEARLNKALYDYLERRCSIVETAYDLSPLLRAAPCEGAAPAGSFDGTGGRLYLVPANSPASRSEIARILREGYDVGLLSQGFQDLALGMGLDHVLVDTRSGLTEETLSCIAISNLVIVVLRPDQQDYQGTAVTVDVVRRLGVSRVALVINQVPSGFDLDAVQRQVSPIFQTPVAGVLPLSEEVARLAGGGVIGLHSPDHPFARRIRDIAAQIAAHPAATQSAAGAAHGKR